MSFVITPMEWEWVDANLKYEGWDCNSLIGHWQVVGVKGDWQAWDYDDDNIIGTYATPDEAKAICRDEYERRVRSLVTEVKP